MGGRQIVYYECDDPSCGLRFPELREGLPRERCPICRGRVRIAMEIDAPTYENSSLPGIEKTRPMAGLLDNIRSGLNVGSIFRTADGIGIGRLYLCGITPSPEREAVRKTSLGAETNVTWKSVNNGVTKAVELKAKGSSLWALETTPAADSLYTLGDKIPEKPLVLVVGNEVCGVDPMILEHCERIVSIPMVGKKRSYNVATAFGIAASYLHYCQIFSQGSESRLPNSMLIP
jgi:23S rRNA (guanosine2251-2'-O)-methyltransferase